MRTRTIIFYVAAIANILGCSDDPSHSNQPPAAITITAEVKANSVKLNWTTAVDLEGDSVDYTILLENEIIKEGLTETNYTIFDLRYEKGYTGKIVIKDRKGAKNETTFSFKTGFMFLKSYEVNGLEYFLEYDDKGALIKIERPSAVVGGPISRNAEGKIVLKDNVTYTYNSTGLLSKIDIATGNLAGYSIVEYDNKDRIARVEIERNDANRADVLQEFFYNDLNQIIKITEDIVVPSQSRRIYEKLKFKYDERGNLIEKAIESSDDNITYRLSSTTTFEYDNMKNPWYTIVQEQTNFNSIYIDGPESFRSSIRLGGVGSACYWISINNLIRIVTQYQDWYSQEEHSYNYNFDDYPISAEINYPLIPLTNYTRWNY